MDKPLDAGSDRGPKEIAGALRMNRRHAVGAAVTHEAGAVDHNFESRELLAQYRFAVLRQIDVRARRGDYVVAAHAEGACDMASDKARSANDESADHESNSQQSD